MSHTLCVRNEQQSRRKGFDRVSVCAAIRRQQGLGLQRSLYVVYVCT